MASEYWCGKKSCNDCAGCKIEEKIPCYPDCDGFIGKYMKLSCTDCDAFLSYVDEYIDQNKYKVEEILSDVTNLLKDKFKDIKLFTEDDIEKAVSKLGYNEYH